MSIDVQQAALIARQNDIFRMSLGSDKSVPGRVVRTASLSVFGAYGILAIMRRVSAHADFTPDNDPYGHHDYGSFDIDLCAPPQKICWRIDLYDQDYRWGSEAPTDLSQTRRVLTVMLPQDQ
ncbi:DUF3768 domain-containing protein [Yoonia sp. SS1-5]|uniref:DUF3768 domain-containing protein n=1 Tax=Yoonia rhodophyticola TaxID=3137370 RepID=A0AAN0MD42_9RHOB